jgi:hypothetical protein
MPGRSSMDIQYFGDFWLAMSGLQKRFNLISLFLGKLRAAAHLCSSDFALFEGPRCYRSLPSQRQVELHLQLEFGEQLYIN